MEKITQTPESTVVSAEYVTTVSHEETIPVSQSSEIHVIPTRIAQLKDEIQSIIDARKKVETMKYYENLPYSALPDQLRASAETPLESKQAELRNLEQEIIKNRKYWWQKAVAVTAFFAGGLFGAKDASSQKKPESQVQETVIETPTQ